MSEEHRIQARLVINYENYVTNVRKHESSKVAESLAQYRLTWLEKKNRSANFQGLPDSPSKLSVSNILDIVSDLRGRRNIELSWAQGLGRGRQGLVNGSKCLGLRKNEAAGIRTLAAKSNHHQTC